MRLFAVAASWRPWGLTLALCLLSGVRAPAQETAEEKLHILTDPEAVKKKANTKEKIRPPLEFFRSQVAPFDVLPYAKPNHWCTLGLELRANHNDYAGSIQTAPINLLGMPQEVIYRRDARLVKGQTSRLALQVMLPNVPRELSLEIGRPDSIRPDELWGASLKVLEPHQMLILVLSKQINDYATWNRFQALYPFSLDRADVMAAERARYYRLVLPMDPDKPALSSHPLTWTPISHVIWDGLSPDVLNPNQQQAMLDWLHWGGQLVLVGGATTSFNGLRDSFLAPYLPAEPSGENTLLHRADLVPLANAYPPPRRVARDDPNPEPLTQDDARDRYGQYQPPAPILPAAKRPVFLAGLTPKEGAVGIPLGESKTRLLGVEARVGQGRVLMLALNPHDPALVAWPGLDSFVRRVVLRRPEERVASGGHFSSTGYQPPVYGPLTARELTWVRYLSRDLGAPGQRPEPYLSAPKAATEDSADAPAPATAVTVSPTAPGIPVEIPLVSNLPVGEWLDSSSVPTVARDILQKASGITIPTAGFVLKVIVAYLIALVPLNWLLWRYVLGRREWAWVFVPFLSLAFAVGVERAAAYDLGFDLACDEIDVVETFSNYPRAHVSRFAALYSTGRSKFAVSYPNNPTALALPMSSGNYLRGEEIATGVWQSYPVPALVGFQVQPRSMELFRAEEMISMRGGVRLESDQEGRRLVNETDLELRDAVLVDDSGGDEPTVTAIGTIAPGAKIGLGGGPRPAEPVVGAEIDPTAMLEVLQQPVEQQPASRGELRLVAWSPKPLGGQTIEPAVDRHRGIVAMVVHLRNGPPPSPDGPTYDSLASSDDSLKAVRQQRPAPGASPGPAAAPPATFGRPNPRMSRRQRSATPFLTPPAPGR